MKTINAVLNLWKVTLYLICVVIRLNIVWSYGLNGFLKFEYKSSSLDGNWVNGRGE